MTKVSSTHLPKDVVAPNPGHIVGTPQPRTRMNKVNLERAEAHQAMAPIPPRLLDLAGAAAYLCVSKWTVRDLEAAGILPRVRVPLAHQGELRKLLFDRTDLDKAIEAWKERFPNA